MKLLITGANGFVGRVLCSHLMAGGHVVRALVRRAAVLGEAELVVADLLQDKDYSGALADIDVVVHLAARVHQMREDKANAGNAYRSMNVEVTRRLVEQAIVAGVKRFVLVSTIKVNGEKTGDRPFVEEDVPAPMDWYGRSKLEAEEVLRQLAEAGGMEWVVVRPTLVFGPGVRGNFSSLMRLVRGRVPLPIGCVRARRSYVNVRNLAELLGLCCTQAAAAGEVFLAADCALSTPELVRALGRQMGIRPLLLPVPVGLLKRVARACGAGPAVDRLTGALEADAEKAKRLLGWQAGYGLEAALKETVTHMLTLSERGAR